MCRLRHVFFYCFFGDLEPFSRLALRQTFDAPQQKNLARALGEPPQDPDHQVNLVAERDLVFRRAFGRGNIEVVEIAHAGDRHDVGPANVIQQNRLRHFDRIENRIADVIDVVDRADPGIHLLDNVVGIDAGDALAVEPCANPWFDRQKMALHPLSSRAQPLQHQGTPALPRDNSRAREAIVSAPGHALVVKAASDVHPPDMRCDRPPLWFAAGTPRALCSSCPSQTTYSPLYSRNIPSAAA